jgi:hypothetical protein
LGGMDETPGRRDLKCSYIGEYWRPIDDHISTKKARNQSTLTCKVSEMIISIDSQSRNNSI